MNNPYEKCPVFETESFILRLVEKNDAKDLLKCYSDENAQPLFNADNCTSNFIYKTIEEMNQCIDFWIYAYKDKGFIRFSIIDKMTKRIIGIIEMFGSNCEFGKITSWGILRIDIQSNYETEKYLSELIKLSVNNFYILFGIKNILSKAIPKAQNRIKILLDNGFIDYIDETEKPRKYYYYRNEK